MIAIDQKNYNWKKFHLYGELVAGIVFVLLSFFSSLKGDSIGAILFFFFLICAIYSLWHFYYFMSNKAYIQVSQKGMSITPIHFKGRIKFIEWENITKVKIGRKMMMTLSLLSGKNVKISLGMVSKDDRISLEKLINDVVKGNSLTPDNSPRPENKKTTDNKNILPEAFKCPNCSEDLELDRTERVNKKFTCPACNKSIDLSKS